jgi:hypothetical protein
VEPSRSLDPYQRIDCGLTLTSRYLGPIAGVDASTATEVGLPPYGNGAYNNMLSNPVPSNAASSYGFLTTNGGTCLDPGWPTADVGVIEEPFVALVTILRHLRIAYEYDIEISSSRIGLVLLRSGSVATASCKYQITRSGWARRIHRSRQESW